MEYYAAIKRSKSESVLVDEPKACYTEWSKSEKEKQILYINAYIWNLEKLYWWTYFQGRNRETDIDNGFVDTVREGEGQIERIALIQIHYHMQNR